MKINFFLIILISGNYIFRKCVASEFVNSTNMTGRIKTNQSQHHSETFKVIDWKFEEVKYYLIFASFIVVVIMMKIIYHLVPRMSKYVPESCLLVIIGILFGVIIKFILSRESTTYFKLTPKLFFYVLLPPIILESSYTLYHRNFLDNLLSILIFAVFGTLLNFLLIGFTLYGFSQVGLMKNLKLNLLHCLLFSSLIVAVDPVAVLAIFNEVGVNEDLYYLVFGESLLNDAVTVVLYEMMQEFAIMKQISVKNLILGFVSFFTVSLGGMIIGIVFGILSCLTIRIMTDKHTVFLEPVFLIGMGYMSYLFADLFGWSGIISMIACGLVQAAYALPGISGKTNFILKRFIKIIASISEPLIFLFLGVEIVIGVHEWEISFIMCSLILCLGARFIVIFILSGIINYIHMSIRNIPMQEKFIISYGGLRGAVAFSLAVLIKPDIFNSSEISNNTIITTTLIIILFTIIVQGMTIKPLVKCLQISKISKVKQLGLFNELNDSVIEATAKGIGIIVGKCGQNYVLRKIEDFSEHFLRPILQGRINQNGKFVKMNKKINDALLMSLSTGQSQKQLSRLPNSYKNLLSAIENPHLMHEEKPVATRAVRRIKLMHTMSDVSEHPSIKPVKRLAPYLYRASAIMVDEDENWVIEPPLTNVVRNVTSVNKAKDTFLGKLRKNKDQGPEESMSLVQPDQSQQKLTSESGIDEEKTEEETNFY